MQLYLDSCVLIYALEGYSSLRQQTLSQLERYAGDEWVISDLVRMECLVGPLRSADQLRLQAFRSFFSDCRVVPLNGEVMDRAAEIRAVTRMQTADAIHMAAAQIWGCGALLTNDKAFSLDDPPLVVVRLDQAAGDQPTG
jgi:uncharacterized protein